MKQKQEYKEILLSDIVPTSDNQRKFGKKPDAEDVELAENIKGGGVRQPVQVRPHPDKKGKYELRAGERRFRAAKAAGVKTIPAIVYTGLAETDAIDLTFIENKFRKNLKPLEEAAEVSLLLERFGSIKAIIKKYGRNPQWWQVRANVAFGLIKCWKEVTGNSEKHPEFRNWTLAHLGQIARLPKHIQEGLFNEIKRSYQYKAELISAVELGEIIAGALHLLPKSKWELDDETLLPKAGACSKCEKRSGHQPILWFESDDQAQAGDQCLDEIGRASCRERV